MFSANIRIIAVIVVMLFIGLFLTACGKIKSTETKTAGINAKIEKLFEHEGCTVYRFHDQNYWRYYAKCSNATSSNTSWSQSCGKGCTSHPVVPTGYERN